MTLPLLSPWTGPFGGLPPLDRIDPATFPEALAQGMAEMRAEIAAIVETNAQPDFANTILAFERAGATFARVVAMFALWRASLQDATFRAVEREMAPKLAAFRDEIHHDGRLFARIDAAYEGLTAPGAGAGPEDRRLAWNIRHQFIQRGAALDAAAKARLAEINQALALRYTTFAQNVLAEEEAQALVIDRAEDLAGLSPALVAAAAAEAERRGKPGSWVFANTRSSLAPFLAQSENRALREAAWRLWVNRGDNGGPHDNNAIVTEILGLRAEKARIMGHETYAHLHLADTMAKTPEPVMDLLMAVWRPALARARDDIAAMQAIIDAEGGGFALAPWDHRHYAEKLRRETLDLDMAEMTPHLRLDRVVGAMFSIGARLYGLRFEPLSDIPVYHPDVSVYAVREATAEDPGRLVGLFYFDPYARAGKSSGAWMSAWRDQRRLDGAVTPIVTNNSNFIAGVASGDPAAKAATVFISWTDAVTLFHEFGHGLHGLLSDVTYASLSGTKVVRDFVELPSMLHENWLTTDFVLGQLLDDQGRRPPEHLIARLRAAQTFNQGFDSVEFLASAIVDMRLHLEPDPRIDPRAFEAQVLNEIGMPPEIVMRHRIPHFAHVFASEGYAAGYYGYLWADVLAADAFEAFIEAGDPYDPDLARLLRATILSAGNTRDAAEAFRAFRGRDPSPEALLRARGFA